VVPQQIAAQAQVQKQLQPMDLVLRQVVQWRLNSGMAWVGIWEIT
jgi:hypothetical protein